MKVYTQRIDFVKEDEIHFVVWRVDLVGVRTLEVGRTAENLLQK